MVITKYPEGGGIYIGEIDDENVEEDSQNGHEDMDEEDAAYDMDDWSGEEL